MIEKKRQKAQEKSRLKKGGTEVDPGARKSDDQPSHSSLSHQDNRNSKYRKKT